MKHLAKIMLLAAAPAALVTGAAPASAGTSAYVGEVSLTGYNFCPRGTLETAGQLLPIASNTALFSLLGTIYGGDGRTTFALPDLRGRRAIGDGSRPGGMTVRIGERGGRESIVLTQANLPVHSHSAELRGENAVLANSRNPHGGALALAGQNIYSNSNAPQASVKLATGSVFVNNAGGNTSFGNNDPFLGMRYCIATVGIYPSRS